jgi:hypothetical protein
MGRGGEMDRISMQQRRITCERCTLIDALVHGGVDTMATEAGREWIKQEKLFERLNQNTLEA